MTRNASAVGDGRPGSPFSTAARKRFAAELGGKVEPALAVLRFERVEPDDRGDAVSDLLQRAGARPPAVGVHDQADVLEVLPFEHVDEVGDVGVEIDVLAHEVRALADAGERRREHLVALLFQQVRHAPPAPAAVPRAVHQHECLGLTGLRQRRRAAQRRCACAGTGAREHRAASEGCVIGCSHRFLLAIFCWRILAPARGSVPRSRRDAVPGTALIGSLFSRPCMEWAKRAPEVRSLAGPHAHPCQMRCAVAWAFGFAHGGGCLWITGTIPRILAGARRCPILTGHRIITAWPHALSAPISR